MRRAARKNFRAHAESNGEYAVAGCPSRAKIGCLDGYWKFRRSNTKETAQQGSLLAICLRLFSLDRSDKD